MGFFIDWLIVATAVSAGLIAITATGSIYFGMFCYIDGMVKDVRSRLIGPEVAGVHQFSDEVKSWSLFVREIEFHVEISGYFALYASFSSLYTPFSPLLTTFSSF